ncbi:hypothetical protein B0T22DRAFT_465924 [Podospora appendiculata]|uniref:Secreted protein n=1 Tax=Podospora appendiculata TaxID=314037 RepID=A0AAE0X5E3_9PEZI|nr:hypothetical protein B0T22DRAFT_465924 [Podospora appendiculata]
MRRSVVCFFMVLRACPICMFMLQTPAHLKAAGGNPRPSGRGGCRSIIPLRTSQPARSRSNRNSHGQQGAKLVC